ncbi:hypothetical protein B5K06_28325 [Rhizobium grahamii]|uniref:Uncharacterized protein n=1 Tax=Rhizobium grahamii TaxID=1120045 RepID=A0A370KGG2_9HYPH|nr:hypothetical protein B5K06_28325 [Rhizobium grahamii]
MIGRTKIGERVGNSTPPPKFDASSKKRQIAHAATLYIKTEEEGQSERPDCQEQLAALDHQRPAGKRRQTFQ